MNEPFPAEVTTFSGGLAVEVKRERYQNACLGTMLGVKCEVC